MGNACSFYKTATGTTIGRLTGTEPGKYLCISTRLSHITMNFGLAIVTKIFFLVSILVSDFSIPDTKTVDPVSKFTALLVLVLDFPYTTHWYQCRNTVNVFVSVSVILTPEILVSVSGLRIMDMYIRIFVFMRVACRMCIVCT